MKKKIVIANWKMNPPTLAEGEQIVEYLSEHASLFSDPTKMELVICPPFIYLSDISRIVGLSSLREWVSIGAQDASWEEKGPDTGEISVPMLSKMDTRYVIVGHSERRWKMGETDEVVRKKLEAVLRSDLIPIVCVGEKERGDAGEGLDFIKKQIDAAFEGLDDVSRCLIAYEPVWAIHGTVGAEADNPDSALTMIQNIRQYVAEECNISDARVLYGGSVNPENIASFAVHTNIENGIDGFLVGNASLDKEKFIHILRTVYETV